MTYQMLIHAFIKWSLSFISVFLFLIFANLMLWAIIRYINISVMLSVTPNTLKYFDLWMFWKKTQQNTRDIKHKKSFN